MVKDSRPTSTRRKEERGGGKRRRKEEKGGRKERKGEGLPRLPREIACD